MFGFLEKLIIKRIAKKLIKAYPSFKEKGLEIIKEHHDEIMLKIKNIIFQMINSNKNK